MTISFQQVSTAVVDGCSFCNWNDAAYWTAGIPNDGADVTVNAPHNPNPSSLGDIASLYLDQLTIEDGRVRVTDSLGSITMATSRRPATPSPRTPSPDWRRSL